MGANQPKYQINRFHLTFEGSAGPRSLHIAAARENHLLTTAFRPDRAVFITGGGTLCIFKANSLQFVFCLDSVAALTLCLGLLCFNPQFCKYIQKMQNNWWF